MKSLKVRVDKRSSQFRVEWITRILVTCYSKYTATDGWLFLTFLVVKKTSLKTKKNVLEPWSGCALRTQDVARLGSGTSRGRRSGRWH